MGEVWTGKYADEINGASKKYNLDPFLISAVIDTESSWNPNSGSGAGAKGLMQLMSDTFKQYGSGSIMNPKDNIYAGTRYLSIQIKNFGTVQLGLAAYNAGPGNVTRYKGIPPFKETQAYVPKVMKKWAEYKGGKVVEGAQETVSNLKTGNATIDGLLKTPVLWVALLIAFLIK